MNLEQKQMQYEFLKKSMNMRVRLYKNDFDVIGTVIEVTKRYVVIRLNKETTITVKLKDVYWVLRERKGLDLLKARWG